MDGLLIVNKSKGITSFKVVSDIRKKSHQKKVGHTGTLDPLATGVLPVVLGKATKLFDFIMSHEKEYIATIEFGKSYDTLDITGNVIGENPIDEVLSSRIFKDEDYLKDILNGFLGDVDQVPPMFSAIKKDGVKMYDLARKGIEIELESRKIHISHIELIEVNKPFIKIRVSCSKGTYIRSLIRDIAQKIGLHAAMSDLVRTRTGDFKIEDAVVLDDITEENIENSLISLEDLLKEFEALYIDEKFLKLLHNGVDVKDSSATQGLKNDKTYRLYNKKKEFLGLASFKEGALTQIFRV